MIGLLQRVSRADVSVDGTVIAAIDAGLLVLIGVERGDTEEQVARMSERLLNYRVFADAEGRMNLNVQQVNGGMLLVPQFTLAADTSRGNRPGFSRAADAATGAALFAALVTVAHESLETVECGQFGADMAVSLINDGPVTFSLQVPPSA